MKTIIVAFIFSLSCCMLQAQIPAAIIDSTPMKCKWDLRNIIYPNIAVTAPIRYGKITATPSYKDVEFANDDNCTNTIDNCTVNDTTDLVYLVYYPINHNYDSLALPALFMFHEGGLLYRLYRSFYG